MSEIEKKVIWIIGGSGGIGSNLAQRMSDEGWNVVISARNQEKLDLVSNQKDRSKVKPEETLHFACLQS